MLQCRNRYDIIIVITLVKEVCFVRRKPTKQTYVRRKMKRQDETVQNQQDMPEQAATHTDIDAAQALADESCATQKTDGDNLAAAEAEIPYPRKKSSRLWSNLFFILSLILSLYLIYELGRSTDLGDEKSLAEVIANINYKFLLLSVAAVFVIIGLDSLKYFVIIRATKVKARFGTALRVGLYGRYYDNITPFTSGGQPMQIYFLHKQGIGGGESSAIIFIKYAFNMTMWLLACCLLMTLNKGALATYVQDETQRSLFTVAGWIGFGINCFLPVLILSFAVFPKMTWAITRLVLNIGHKLRIVKNKESVLDKARRAVNAFVAAFVSMVKKPFHSIILALLCIAEPVLSMMLPYFVVAALGGNAVTPSWELMFAIMTLNVYVSMSVTIIPTPGSSGAIESAFMLTLVNISEGVLFWTVLTWRFLSYYIYILIGLIMIIVHIVRTNRRKNLQIQTR